MKSTLGVFLLAYCMMVPAVGLDGYEQGQAHYEAGDYAKAYCIWRELAKKDHVAAQYSLGWMFYNGEGLSVNAQEGVNWWKKSAKQGHPDAHFAIGLAYTAGDGVKRNTLEAIRWHLDASQLGHEDARGILRGMILSGFNRRPLEQRKLLEAAWRMLGTSNVIHAPVANIRTGPGTKNRVLMTIKKDDEIVEFKTQKRWVQIGVRKKHKVGWVHQSLIE